MHDFSSELLWLWIYFTGMQLKIIILISYANVSKLTIFVLLITHWALSHVNGKKVSWYWNKNKVEIKLAISKCILKFFQIKSLDEWQNYIRGKAVFHSLRKWALNCSKSCTPWSATRSFRVSISTFAVICTVLCTWLKASKADVSWVRRKRIYYKGIESSWNCWEFSKI